MKGSPSKTSTASSKNSSDANEQRLTGDDRRSPLTPAPSMSMSDQRKSISRSLGEFFGYIVRGFKADVSKQDDRSRERRVVRCDTEEEDRGDVVLRRTTIEEVEFRGERRAGDGERPDEG